MHNPQTSSGAKASSAQTMSSYQAAARNVAAGYNGVVHNVRIFGPLLAVG